MQLNLEAIYFSLCRFCSYQLESPNETVVITDYYPQANIFNGKRFGSIKKQRMKLRHQDIRFFLNYSQGQKNPADYPSRPAIS